MATTQDKIAGLYAAFFNRAPDKAGFDEWVTKLDADTATLNDIAAGFAEHATFTSTYGDMDDQAFVEAIYQNVLGQAGDAAGIADQLAALSDGTYATRADFVAGFVASALEVDLTSAEFADLTEAELAAAQQRQDTLQNKVDAGQYFMTTWGDATNVADAASPETDANYIASIAALAGIDDTAASLTAAEATIDDMALEAPVEPVVPGVEGSKFYLTSATDAAYEGATGIDTTGTDNDDNYYAYIQQNAFAGGVSNSLSSADQIDGGAGTDTLTAELVAEFVGATSDYQVDVQARTTDVENVTFEARDSGSNDTETVAVFDSVNDVVVLTEVNANSLISVDAKYMTGVERIGSLFSDGDLVIENLTTLSDTGAIRSTSAMTITMDHTDSLDHDNDASDLTVLFDEDYLNITTSNEGSTLTINMINTLNLAVAAGDSLVEGFETVTFSVGEDLITVDVTGAEITEVQGLIEDAVAAAGYADITVSTYQEPAYFGTNIYYEETATTYSAGTYAGMYTAFILTNAGEEELTEGGFTFVDGQKDGSIAYSQDDSEASQVTSPITINVELDKVGRDGEGGDLIIGAKNLDTNGHDTDVDQHDGINVFDITVMGDEDRPSNLGIITSTNNALDTVNIASEARTDGSYAALTVRDAFGGTLDTLNANAFMGDLAIGQITNAVNIDTFTATGGGDVYLNEDIGAADNGTTGSFTSLQDNAYSVTTGAGADTIIVDANSGAQLTVVSGAGNDGITVSIDGADASGSDLTFADISSSAGNNTVTVTSSDALHSADIDLGAGADTVRGNTVMINADTGSGNDTIYASNVGDNTNTANGYTDASLAVTAVTTALGDQTFTTTQGGTVAETELLYGRSVQVTLSVSGVDAEDFTEGFESALIAINASNSYLSTELDLYKAIQTAINDDAILSKLAVASIDSLGNLTVNYLVDGVATDATTVAVDYTIFDNDLVNGLSAIEKTAMANQLIAEKGDSEIDAAEAFAAWDAVSDADIIGRDIIVVNGGVDSSDLADNIVNGGLGDDVIVLNSNDTDTVPGTADTTDTIMIDAGGFGNDTIVHFEVDTAGPTVGDIIDFTYLSNLASPSGSLVTGNDIAGTVVAAGAMGNNTVTQTSFAALDDAYDSTAGLLDFDTLTNAQVLAALNGSAANGVAATFDVTTLDGTLYGDVVKSVLMIENADNLGEYKVYEVAADASDVALSSDDSYTSATLVGTLDFGHTITLLDGNIA